jgi:hypothetical protein
VAEEAWFDVVDEGFVRRLFASRGVRSVYLKSLGVNNNSKQQIYLAGDLTDLALLPLGEVTSTAGTSKKPGGGKPIFHSTLDWTWLLPDGESPAPNAQLIYYPQYPEVRLSGLLAGSSRAPSVLLSIEKRGQEVGRILMFGEGADGRVYGLLVGAPSPAAQSLSRFAAPGGLLSLVPIVEAAPVDPRELITRELARIHRLGWINAAQLTSDGVMAECKGPRCVGHTLEAHLGITMNGVADPDFGIWEVKAHKVSSFTRAASGRVTLFTPEPDGGRYAEHGVGWFVQNYGRKSEDGSRFDFTGIHSAAAPAPRTGLQLTVVGYDAASRSIQSDGAIALTDQSGEIASSWSFSKLIEHWQRKHAYAAYVAALSEAGEPYRFSYGNMAHFAEGTRFEKFLLAVSSGAVYYDPGINSKVQPNGSWKAKARSQFRINFKQLGLLYDTFEEVDVLAS